jgi:hypothetical protein
MWGGALERERGWCRRESKVRLEHHEVHGTWRACDARKKNLDLLDSLNTQQLRLEIAVLRQTVSESIRERKLVRVNGGKNF